MRRIVAIAVAFVLSQGLPAAVITQRTTVDAVSVAVTAGNLSAEASVWDFAVVLHDARGRNLGDDLLQSAVLIDQRGRRYKPLIWEGAPAAGDHRAGVLKFIAIEPRPDSIELRINRAGEKKARSFSWLLGSALLARV